MRTVASGSLFRRLVSPVAWPAIFTACVAAIAWGISIGRGPQVFTITYVCLALTLFVLERVMPHEPVWLRDDGQMLPDLLHTLLSKLFAYYLVVAGGSLGLFDALRVSQPLWPGHWPLWLQICLGLVVAEFGFYWAHRFSHEWKWLWPFHAVHHSVRRLWFFNTGRFHIVDTLRSMVFGLPLLFVLGAPEIIFTWVSAVTAVIGLLTHCNIDMRTRWLHCVFNTPALHRWHHSRDLREGNSNYGENLMLWDVLFGTYFDASRRPPADIGIAEFMPRHYLGQVFAPFRWRRLQADADAGLLPAAERV
jgi:sterol desaturase/sphingolipid hydroxylase (fatty acid hydroxylase superfamily)